MRSNKPFRPSRDELPCRFSCSVLSAAPLSAVQPILPKPVLPSVGSRPVVMEQVSAAAPSASSAVPSAVPTMPSTVPSVPSTTPSVPSAAPSIPSTSKNPPAPQSEAQSPQDATIVHFYVDDPSLAKAENPNLFVDPDVSLASRVTCRREIAGSAVRTRSAGSGGTCLPRSTFPRDCGFVS